MKSKSKIINLSKFQNVDEKYIEQNLLNIYTLAAHIEEIENRVFEKVS